MAAPSALSPSSDASHLRRLLERQPACLIRVRLDGVLLACNHAALGLFGVGTRRAVLNTNLTDRIVPAQRAQWQEFMTRCWKGAASFECHLVIRDNKARPVLVQGIALKDHPDGFESLLLHLRDQSQTQRLEHSIQRAVIDRLANEEDQRAAGDQIEAAIAERLEFALPADEDQAERRRLVEALEAQTADRQRREAKFVELEKKLEESRLVLLQKEREHHRDVAMLKSALAAARAAKTAVVAGHEQQELEAVKQRLQGVTAEQARLQALVAEYEVDRNRIAADHQAAIDTLQQSLARAGEEAALDLEQSRQALAESRSELAQALAEQSRMAARAEEQTREHDLMLAEHHRARVDLEASKDAALAELRSELARTSAERGSLAGRVEVTERELDLLRAEHERAHDRLIAEHHRALADVETGKREALDGLRSQQSQALADQRRLAARLEAHEGERDSLIAQHHRALADMETRTQELEAVKLRLQAVTAEQARLQALVAEHEVDRKRIAADHQAAIDTLQRSMACAGEEAALDLEQSRQAVAESRSELAQALAEQSRMAARAEEQTREHDLMLAEHHRVRVDFEASKDAALAELRSELARTSAERGSLAGRVEVAERELDLLRGEHERAHDRLIAEHHRALADVETGKREALAELRSQLSQTFADQRRLASRADEQELELDRLRAEHYAALTDVETRNRDALAELRSELAQAAAEPSRILAERAEEHERERNRMSAEHNLVIADLQASKQAAAAELRSQLSEAVAEHHRLTALLEEHDRERERMAAEHRRAIADLQASKHEAVAECERVLTEVQQALLVRDASRRLEIERRLIDGIDEGPQTKVDGARLASLQRGLTLAFSQMQAVLKDEPALKQPLEAEHDALERPGIETIDKVATAAADDERFEDVDLLHEPFDDADDAFVQHLLEGIHATWPPETRTDTKTVGPAQAVSGMQALTTGDQPAQDVFDAQDATFVRSLMNTPGPPRESIDQTDAEPLQELPQAQPSAPEDS